MNNQINNGELNLEKLYMILGNYKWLILSLMFLSSTLMFANLYFKPSVYLSTGILEIKSKSKPKMPNDILLSALSFGSSGKVEKEIELLKTFLINQKALEKTDFSVKYFKTKSYKDIEIYNTSPIKVTDISIYNKNIIGKKITLHPHNNYFTLSIKNSLIDSLFSFMSPVTYIKFDTKKKYLYGETIKNDFYQITINKDKKFNTAIKFILSGSKRRIYDDIIKKRLSVQQINPNAPLIEISFEDNIPSRGNDYINSLSQGFINTSVNSKNEQNNRVLTFINQQLAKIKTTLQDSEDKLEGYKTKHKIVEPSIQAKKYIEKLSELEIKLSENTLKQKLIRNLLSFAQKNSNLGAIAPSLMELNDKPTLQLITTLQNLQITADNLKTELTNKHPKVITIQRQMYHIRNKILYNLKNLKSLILQKYHSIKEEKLSYESKIQSLPKEEKKIVNINRNYQVSATMYNYLLKKKTESELLVISMLSDYKIIDKAHANSKAIKPKKTLLMLVSPLIGLLLGILLATILHGLNNKISSREELERLTNLPLLGLIPQLNKSKVNLEVYEDSQSNFTESFRSLRSNLPTKTKEDEVAKVILITSIIASEGKTTITSNLASIFQMAGHKSIILSLDLRKPALHNYFDLENERGMSSYLRGEDSVQDIIFATKHTNLHAITSGPIPDNPSELILSSKLLELLELLKTRYDYIFIDTAPIGLVSDSINLMKLADQNLIVLRENYAEESFLSSLDDLIRKNKLENVGLILNRSKSKTISYGYGYGYGYGA